MSSELLAAITSAAGALIVALLGYFFTKRAEREATWRNEKLVYYKAFVSSLSGIIEGEAVEGGQQQFARACNDMLLFAPQRVIRALAQFQDEIRVSNAEKSRECHDKLLSQLLLEIRRDLHVSPKDSPEFQVHLWASGVKSRSELQREAPNTDLKRTDIALSRGPDA